MKKHTSLINFEGIILYTTKTHAADKCITVFSKEYGKCSFWSPATRSSKSKLGSSLQPFTHLDLMLKVTDGKFILQQCEVINSNRHLLATLDHLMYASLVSEIITSLWPEQKQDLPVFKLLSNFLFVATKRNVRIASLIASWQLVELAGFKPEFSMCVSCCEPYTINRSYTFSSTKGGLVCSHCIALIPDYSSIWNESLYKFFTEVVFTYNWNTSSSFSVKQAVISSAENLLHEFLLQQTDTMLKSLQFAKKIYT